MQIGSNGIIKENNVALGNGSTVSVPKGSTKTFTIIPNTGYEIASLQYNGIDVKSQLESNQYTIPAINANSTLNVTFKKQSFKITVQTGSLGTMNLNFYYGETPAFDFTPSTGYRIQTVFYNNNDVTSDLIGNVYTLPAITSNGTLVVSFVGLSTDANQQNQKAIKIYSVGSEIVVQGLDEGEMIELYNLNGSLLQTLKSEANGVIFRVQPSNIYLIRTEYNTFKVIL